MEGEEGLTSASASGSGSAENFTDEVVALAFMFFLFELLQDKNLRRGLNCVEEEDKSEHSIRFCIHILRLCDEHLS